MNEQKKMSKDTVITAGKISEKDLKGVVNVIRNFRIAISNIRLYPWDISFVIRSGLILPFSGDLL